nr:ribonuclease H-like domain-containing protein [Tanacetum cinerariifolium]
MQFYLLIQGTSCPLKPDLVFADEHVVSESVTSLPSISKSKVKTSESKLKTVSEPIIKDWVSDILTNPGLKTLNTARQTSSRAAISDNTARPINTAYPRSTVNGARPALNVFLKAHSHVRRPFNKFTINKNSTFNQKVNTVKENVTNVGSKAVEKGVIDSRCSRHMTGNMSYFFEYEEIDGGYVAFGGDLKGGKITDIECVVLSPKFKLLDESQVLLRVPRKNNMYSVDLRNIAPLGATKDETSGILKAFITGIENLIDHKERIKCAKTPQQNGVAERKNKTLIETVRTMLADLKLPTTFWAKAVNTACYVQNRVLVIKPHNKTPYEIFLVKKHVLSFMRPFECPVTILNTLDHLGQAEKKTVPGLQYVLLPLLTSDSQDLKSSKDEVSDDARKKKITQRNEFENLPTNPLVPDLEDTANTRIFSGAYDDEVEGAVVDFNNLELTTVVSPIPTTRIHKDHPKEQIIGDPL